MPYPNRVERDCQIIDWSAQVPWCTTFYDPQPGTATVRSDGVLNPDFGCVWVRNFTGNITARRASAVGVHVDGPITGDEYTPYQVIVNAWCEDVTLRPMLFVGESPASPTSGAAGDSVTNCHLIGCGDVASSEGSALSRELVVAAPVNTADRGLCFFVALYAGSGAGTNLRGFVDMSVRRLIGVNPALLDSTKL